MLNNLIGHAKRMRGKVRDYIDSWYKGQGQHAQREAEAEYRFALNKYQIAYWKKWGKRPPDYKAREEVMKLVQPNLDEQYAANKETRQAFMSQFNREQKKFDKLKVSRLGSVDNHRAAMIVATRLRFAA